MELDDQLDLIVQGQDAADMTDFGDAGPGVAVLFQVLIPDSEPVNQGNGFFKGECVHGLGFVLTWWVHAGLIAAG